MVAHMSHAEYLPRQRVLLIPFLLFVILACSGLAPNTGVLAAFWVVHFVVAVTYTAVFLILVVLDLCHLLDVYAFRIKAPAKAGPTTNGFAGNKSD